MTDNKQTIEGQGQGADTRMMRADMLDSLIAHYVAGSLPEPLECMVGAHLDMQPKSKRFVENIEQLAGEEMARLEPVPLGDRNKALSAIFEGDIRFEGRPTTPVGEACPVFPGRLREFVGHAAKDIPWRSKLPGFREYRIGEFDGFEANLLWIRPGRAMPAHSHEGSELTLVLDGGFSDESGHYLRGDIAVADETIDHRPVADDDGPCICFAVTTAPLKLTGSVGQLFSDIFGR